MSSGVPWAAPGAVSGGRAGPHLTVPCCQCRHPSARRGQGSLLVLLLLSRPHTEAPQPRPRGQLGWRDPPAACPCVQATSSSQDVSIPPAVDSSHTRERFVPQLCRARVSARLTTWGACTPGAHRAWGPRQTPDEREAVPAAPGGQVRGEYRLLAQVATRRRPTEPGPVTVRLQGRGSVSAPGK